MKKSFKDYHADITRLYYEGVTPATIAKKYGLHSSSVRDFIRTNLSNIYDANIPWLLNSKHYPPGSKERKECREINHVLTQLKAIEVLGE